MADAVQKQNGLGKLGQFMYASESEYCNTDTQGTDSGKRWILNQKHSKEDWHHRYGGQNP